MKTYLELSSELFDETSENVINVLREIEPESTKLLHLAKDKNEDLHQLAIEVYDDVSNYLLVAEFYPHRVNECYVSNVEKILVSFFLLKQIFN